MTATPADRPQPTDDERTLAMVCWLVDFVLHVIGPWLFWKLAAGKSAYVGHHAKASANNTLTMMVVALIVCVVFGGAGWGCLELAGGQNPEQGFGFLIAAVVLLILTVVALLALGVFWFVLRVLGAMRAMAGVWYTPPLCWPMIW